MLNNDELGRAYGLGYYSRDKHDIIADTYLMGRETFHYRPDPSMTRSQAFRKHLRIVHRKVRSDYYKEEKKKVYIDYIQEPAVPTEDECHFENITNRVFSGRDAYLFTAEKIQNRLLVSEIQSFVNDLLSNHDKKTRQMLLLRYSEGLTLEQLGWRLRCSKSKVDRKIKKAVAQLRAAIQRKGLQYQDCSRFKPQFIYRKPDRILETQALFEEKLAA